MANETIKYYAKSKDVKLWQIADKLKITDFTFSRKLRKELDDESKKKITAIIDDLAKNKEA